MLTLVLSTKTNTSTISLRVIISLIINIIPNNNSKRGTSHSLQLRVRQEKVRDLSDNIIYNE